MTKCSSMWATRLFAPSTVTVNVAVECETRGEVLMNFDKSDEDTE